MSNPWPEVRVATKQKISSEDIRVLKKKRWARFIPSGGNRMSRWSRKMTKLRDILECSALREEYNAWHGWLLD